MEKTVMIVDDASVIRAAVSDVLKPKGFEVVTASSGRECLEELKKGFKGVILMDIMMPVMDGWDTIREIVDGGFIKENIIIVILTARGGPSRKIEGLQAYVTDYISKPFDPDELVAIVKEYLGYLK